jgi:acetyl esterase/lipase
MAHPRIRPRRRIRKAAAAIAAALLLSLVRQPRAAEAVPGYAEHQDLTYYLDSDGGKQPVRTIADWEIRRRHALAQMQIVMGPLPRPERPVPLETQVVDSTELTVPVEGADWNAASDSRPAEAALIRRKITYHTDSPDRRVSAWLFLPQPGETSSETPRGRSPKRPAVLCLHQTVAIGKDEPAGLGMNENLRYALHLASRGYVTLAPDYPSFGEYQYDFDADDYISGTMKAIYDNIRAVDLLQSLPEVDPERIGCVGHSLGGHNTMFTAAFDPRIKAVVSNCGFTRFHKYYGGKLEGWTSDRYMPLISTVYGNDPGRVPFDFTEIVGSFAPRPFLASSPLHDDNFEVSGVKDVIAAARPIYELYGQPQNLQANYPDCDHEFPPDVRRVAYEFFDRHLKSDNRRD